MKSIQCLSLCVAGVLWLCASASAAPICLRTSTIKDTKIVDAKTIDFHMIDGSAYRNVLRSACTGLMFDGFVYRVSADEICDNAQSIRVLRSGQVCMLGAFSKIPTRRHEPSAQ